MSTATGDTSVANNANAASLVRAETYESIGGASTHVVINFHLLDDKGNIIDIPIYFGTAITISYSIYRSKQSVFNFGNNLIDGFAIGNKYVAGTLIKGIFTRDELNDALSIIKNGLIASFDPKKLTDISNRNVVHGLMKDDLLSCDINIIYTNEYTGEVQYETIHDATFINNGQVASINDIITESTLSYIARDVKSMERIKSDISGAGNANAIRTATQILFR